MPTSRAFYGYRAPMQRMIGVVLPVVLVVLTVLTGLIVTQIRRNTMDERLAANTRETVQLDNAVQTALRWCEARITLEPQTTATVPASTTAQTAWNFTSPFWTAPPPQTALKFAGGAAILGLSADPACVIEDATCELAPPISPTGQVGASPCPGNGDLDPRWRKFRLTARAFTTSPDFGGGNRAMLTQSELRLFIE